MVPLLNPVDSGQSEEVSKAMNQTKPVASTGRAQSNVDFVIAVFIMLIFFTATLFTAGSPLLESERSEIDYQIDAQRMVVELTEQLSDDAGHIHATDVETMIDGGDLSPYLSTEDSVEANVTLRPTDERNPASLFDGEVERTIGSPIPQTVTSRAAKTVRIDNRGTRLIVTLWVDA